MMRAIVRRPLNSTTAWPGRSRAIHFRRALWRARMSQPRSTVVMRTAVRTTILWAIRASWRDVDLPATVGAAGRVRHERLGLLAHVEPRGRDRAEHGGRLAVAPLLPDAPLVDEARVHPERLGGLGDAQSGGLGDRVRPELRAMLLALAHTGPFRMMPNCFKSHGRSQWYAESAARAICAAVTTRSPSALAASTSFHSPLSAAHGQSPLAHRTCPRRVTRHFRPRRALRKNSCNVIAVSFKWGRACNRPAAFRARAPKRPGGTSPTNTRTLREGSRRAFGRGITRAYLPAYARRRCGAPSRSGAEATLTGLQFASPAVFLFVRGNGPRAVLPQATRADSGT